MSWKGQVTQCTWLFKQWHLSCWVTNKWSTVRSDVLIPWLQGPRDNVCKDSDQCCLSQSWNDTVWLNHFYFHLAFKPPFFFFFVSGWIQCAHRSNVMHEVKRGQQSGEMWQDSSREDREWRVRCAPLAILSGGHHDRVGTPPPLPLLLITLPLLFLMFKLS